MNKELDGLPGRDYLNSRFVYDPETGNLTWRHRSDGSCKSEGERKRWNSSYAGKIAGSELYTVRGSKSKIQVALDGRVLSAHRVIWKMIHGSAPGSPIDHKDGDPFNNRPTNMRVSGNDSNQWNRVAPKNNTSGFKGVTWSTQQSKWKSTVRVSGRYIHLGYHDTIGLAALAQAKGSIRYHGVFSPILRGRDMEPNQTVRTERTTSINDPINSDE